MTSELLLNYVSKMNQTDYEELTVFFLESVYGERVSRIPAMDNALMRNLDGAEAHYFDYKGVYLNNFIPFEFYSNPRDISVDSPNLRKQLRCVRELFADEFFADAQFHIKGFANKLHTIFFMNNLTDMTLDYEYLAKSYEKIVKEEGVNRHYNFMAKVGSIDFFFRNQEKQAANLLNEYINTTFSTSISYTEDYFEVNRCSVDRYLNSGIGKFTQSPYYSLIVERLNRKNEILNEFEYLLNKTSTEHELELFLAKYYKDIFGNKYDRIERQLWLKFPEFDIAGKNRQLDIFLHNAITRDWEIYEIKKIIPLTTTYRDIPVLRREIYYSIEQIRNYRNILQNRDVREHFKRDGIEYYEPSLNLIVGRASTLPHNQFRRLLSEINDVRILTYDDLLLEMQYRLKAHKDFTEITL